MNSEQIWKLECLRRLERGEIRATLMRRGAVVTGWPSRYPCLSDKRTHKRGIVRSATARSLIRGAFAVSNSPVDFDLMTTLTFRDTPSAPKEALRSFCRTLQKWNALGTGWAWFQEYQRRGMVHYHLLHTLEALQTAFPALKASWETVGKGKLSRTVLRGLIEAVIADTWIGSVGDQSLPFRRFQYGGITERVNNPGGVSSYLGDYMRKASQKQLPDGHEPQGRWWFLSADAQPIPGETIIVDRWPYKSPHHFVYDHRPISGDQDLSQPEH